MTQDPSDALFLERLARDLVTTAQLAGVGYELRSIREVLRTFGPELASAPVELRTTTQPVSRRGLSYRFVELDRPLDPLSRALASGLLTAGERPVDRLIPQVQERFGVLGWGVDAEVSAGLEKLWPFLAYQHPIEEAMDLEAMPAAVGHHLAFMRAHRLTHFGIVAADYRHESANLYFMIPPPDAFDADEVAAMIEELGLATGPRERIEHAAAGVALNLTFRWDSPHVERLCLYVPAPTPSDVPAGVHPILDRLVREAPICAAHRSFISGPTFTRAGSYTKLEIDYTGTILGALQRCVAVPRHPPTRRELTTRASAVPRIDAAAPPDRR